VLCCAVLCCAVLCRAVPCRRARLARRLARGPPSTMSRIARPALLALALTASIAASGANAGLGERPHCPADPHRVDELSYWSETAGPLPCMYAGLVEVDKGRSLFYWLHRHQQSVNAERGQAEVPSQAEVPLVVWLQGGPGSSSMLGNLLFHSPIRLERNGTGPDDFELKPAPEGSWATIGNVVYLDQPVGTGFSFGRPVADLATAGRHFVTFLLALADRFPDLSQSPVFITGESYAGKFVPTFSRAVMDYNLNAASDERQIRFGGMMVGDPFVAPARQRTMMHTLPRALNILDSSHLAQVHALESHCEESLVNRSASEHACLDIMHYIVRSSGGVLQYDLRNFDSDWSPREAAIGAFFTLSSQRERIWDQLHVRDSPKQPKFEMSSAAVSAALTQDNLVDYSKVYEELLRDKIPVLVYAGEFDSKDGPVGQERWIRELQFSEAEEFWAQAPSLYWLRTGEMGGYSRAAGTMNFLTVPRAGHFVPANFFRLAMSVLQDFTSSQRLPCHRDAAACSVAATRCELMNGCSGHGRCDALGAGQCSCEPGWVGAACQSPLLRVTSRSASDPLGLQSKGPKWHVMEVMVPCVELAISDQASYDVHISSHNIPDRFDSEIVLRGRRGKSRLSAADLGLPLPYYMSVFVIGADFRSNTLFDAVLSVRQVSAPEGLDGLTSA